MAVRVGVFSTNSCVAGSYVEVVSRPRTKVPVEKGKVRFQCKLGCSDEFKLTMTELCLGVRPNDLVVVSKAKPLLFLLLCTLTLEGGDEHTIVNRQQ